MFKFGRKSLEQLSTCHIDLQLIAQEAIKKSEVDFGINEGHRSLEDQLKYFLQGYSRIDPRIPELRKKGKHLYNPSLAFDIKIYVPERPDLTYDKEHLSYVAGVIMTVAKQLYEEDKVSHKLRWGGNWDMDGTILYDHSLQDRPHFELIM